MVNIIVGFIALEAYKYYDNRKDLKMNDHKVILGEFESELYAEIAKRDLRIAGIKAKTLKKNDYDFLPTSNKEKEVTLIVPVNQIEEAKKILKAKFI